MCSLTARTDLVIEDTMVQESCSRQTLLTSQIGRLVVIGGHLASMTEAADALTALLDDGLGELGADGAVLALWDADGLLVRATAGHASELLSVGLRIPGDAPVPIAAAARDRSPLWVGSRADAASRFPRALDAEPRVQAWAAVPLVVDGVVIGSFGATFPAPHPFARQDRLFFLALASLTAAWCGSHLVGTTRPKEGPWGIARHGPEALLDRLALVSRALSGDVPPYDVLTIALQQAMAGTGAEGGTVAMVDRDQTINPEITIGYPVDTLRGFGPLTLDRLLPITVAALTGAPVWVESRTDALFQFPALLDAPTPSQAWAAVPLLDEGDTFAVLSISFRTPHAFTSAERGFLKALTQLVALRLQLY